MRRILVIFSGYNQRAIISFLRVLEKNLVNCYAIIASSKKDTILKSSYKSKVFTIRKIKELDKIEIFAILEKIKQKFECDSLVIAPTTEALNRFLLKYRTELEKKSCIIPLVEKELYEWISDKEKFGKMCRLSGISVPQEIEVSIKFNEPYVAKPKKYIASNGKVYSPILVFSEEEHQSFLNDYTSEDFIFQKYITGESYYLLYYFSTNGQVYAFSQVNYAQQPKGKSILAAMSTRIHEESISEEFINILKNCRYFGFIMIELRKNKEKYYMIEANPRFWGPSQLFVDAGVPFFEMFLKDNGLIGEAGLKKFLYDARYLWSGGCIDEIIKTDSCIWYGDGKQQVVEHWQDYAQADIYKREDTMEIFEIEKLKKLYMKVSKHSNYQRLPQELAEIIDQNQLKIQSRYEQERFEYMLKHIKFENKDVLEIGGNTGFFTMNILKRGARHVDYYEGNEDHAEFVNLSSKILEVGDRITVYPKYYLFKNCKEKYDIVLNLNVMHHIGDDFDKAESIEIAKKEILLSINQLAFNTHIMIFQMGYNWKGNIEKCLFENGLKQELEQFLLEGTKEYWDIIHTGIAVVDKEKLIYKEKNEKNNIRLNELGEFLNRPIFIMRSKKEI